MERSGTLTLTTADTNYNLLTLILALAGMVPSEGYFPDRVQHLILIANEDNAAGSKIKVGGSNLSATSYAQAMEPADAYVKGPNPLNTICLSDIYVRGSVNSLKLNFSITAR